MSAMGKNKLWKKETLLKEFKELDLFYVKYLTYNYLNKL